MKTALKTTIAAVTFAGAALFASAPAQAGVSFNISIGVPNAIGFDYGSGGYCDTYGCPDAYWDLPVYYGPVYYGGGWYQGPLYYRDFGGERWYWVHNGWRRDEWRGPRPRWWKGNYRSGPALGYDFYRGNGFRHDRDKFWRGNDWRAGRDWDRNRWKGDKGGKGGGSMMGGSMMMGGHDNDHGGKNHDGGGMMGGGGGGSTGGGGMMGGGKKPHSGSSTNPNDIGTEAGPAAPEKGSSGSSDKSKHKNHDSNGGGGN